jgi:hypothetical protein
VLIALACVLLILIVLYCLARARLIREQRRYMAEWKV